MKKKFFIGLFIFAAVGLFTFAHFALKQNEIDNYNNQATLNAPIDIPPTGILNYEEAIKTNKPILAMFYVDWCTYCRRYMPIFAELSILFKDKFSFVAINCENPQYENLAKEYGIMGYPTIYIIDKKLDFEYAVNNVNLIDKKRMVQELEKYLKLRGKALN